MKRKPIIIVLQIVITYLVIAGSYILFSDYYVASISKDQNMITQLQTYKGWGFVFVTSIGLFLILYKLLRNLNKEKEIQLEAQSLLQKSEQMFRLLFLNSGEAILLTNPHGSIDAANPEACNIFGSSEKEICSIGRNGIVDLKDPRLLSALEETNETGKFNGELDFIRKDGTKFPGEVNNVVYRDPQGIIRTSMIIRDISERKRIENELINKNEFIQTVLDNLPIGVALNYMNEGTAFYYNKKFEEIYGWPAEELENISKFFTKVYPDEEYRNSLFGRITADIKSGDINRMHWDNCKVTHKDGSIHFVNAVNIPLFQQNTMVSTVWDITEMKETEEKIFESEVRYRRLHETMFDCYVQTDMSGKIMDVNRSYIEMLGYTKEELLSLTYPDITPQRWFEFEQKIVEEQILTRSYSDIYEKEYIKKNGTVFPVEIRTYLLRDTEGNPESMWAIVRDITNRKKAEQAMQKSEERYRLISSLASDYVFSSDVTDDGTLKLNWVSGSFERITGYTFEEYTTQSGWFKSLHPGDIEIDKLDMEHLKNNKQVITELRTIAKNGNIVWVRVYAQPVWDNQENKLIGIYGAVQDITERKSTELALLKSRKEFQSYFDSNSIGLSVTDYNKTWIEVNQRLCDMLGYTKSELTGHSWIEFTHPDDIDKNLELFNRVLNGEIEKFELDKRFIRKDGTIIFAILSAVCIRNVDGSIDHLLASYNDITERKLAEEELLNSENRLHTLIQTIPDLIWLKDKEGVYLLCNTMFERFFGAAEAEIIGKTDYDFVSNEVADFFRMNDKNAMDLGKPIVNEEQITFADDGHKAFLETIKTPMYDNMGSLIGILGIGRDITARKLAEDALRESEERFHSMFKNHNAIMILLDPETGQIVDANQSAEKYYGYPIEKLKQFNISEINVMPNEELAIKLRNSTLISRSHSNFPHKLSSGEIRLVEEYTSPISVNGKTVLFSIIHDITERKKAEQELFESQEKLRALTARLERVQEEERINLSRELHDHLGQNLTGLKMDTAWLAKKIQSDTPIESDDLIQKTNGMLLLIDELIRNVRKISAELRPNVLDYLGLIPAIEWQIEELKKRTEIDCVLKSNVHKIDLGVQINSSIFRIIQEAFTNVIRHSGANLIEVSIAEESDFIRLEILDNGIGINENNISNLHSLGILGMRERTLQFNGKLHLENAKQGGTLLTLIIPNKN